MRTLALALLGVAAPLHVGEGQVRDGFHRSRDRRCLERLTNFPFGLQGGQAVGSSRPMASYHLAYSRTAAAAAAARSAWHLHNNEPSWRGSEGSLKPVPTHPEAATASPHLASAVAALFLDVTPSGDPAMG